PGRELVLVLLVVLEGEQPVRRDRARHYGGDLGVVAAWRRHLQPFVDGVFAQRGDHLLTDRGQRALRDVLADQIDRRHQRLGLNREQPGRPGEGIAVGLGIYFD